MPVDKGKDKPRSGYYWSILAKASPRSKERLFGKYESGDEARKHVGDLIDPKLVFVILEPARPLRKEPNSEG